MSDPLIEQIPEKTAERRFREDVYAAVFRAIARLSSTANMPHREKDAQIMQAIHDLSALLTVPARDMDDIPF